VSYTRMNVYSFVCERADEYHDTTRGQGDGYEALAPEGTGLRGAEREIRHAGWTVRVNPETGAKEHFCPLHKPSDDTEGE
jgi:hypothetical protein